MRILLLAPHPFYQERGTPIAVDLLLRTLAELGHRVDVLTYHEGEERAYAGDRVRVHRIPPPPWVRNVRPGFSVKKLVCDAWLLPAALRMARQATYDLVHAVEESVFIARRIRRRHGIPYVYDMDSSMPQQIIDKHRCMGVLGALMRRFERAAIRDAAAVVPMCDALADLATRAGAARVAVLRDVPLFDRDAAPAEAEELQALARPRFLYVGNLEPYQGMDLLLHAFARYRGGNGTGALAIVGGAETDVLRYRRVAADLDLDADVHLFGPRPVAMLPALMAAADVLVSPRTQGVNTPMKIYSYLHSGKAVLATDIASHTQVLDDRIAVLTPPTPAALADGMSRLAADAALRQQLGTAAQQRITERYSLAVYRETVASLYGWLAEHSGR